MGRVSGSRKDLSGMPALWTLGEGQGNPIPSSSRTAPVSSPSLDAPTPSAASPPSASYPRRGRACLRRSLLLRPPHGRRLRRIPSWPSVRPPASAASSRQASLDDSWERYVIPATACSRLPDAFLDEERRSICEWWYRQEYLCEVGPRSAGLLERRRVERLLIRDSGAL